jgi:hypothetical protein
MEATFARTTAKQPHRRLANEEKLWDKKLGLLGIWGGLVRRWLQEILPEDAHEISR